MRLVISLGIPKLTLLRLKNFISAIKKIKSRSILKTRWKYLTIEFKFKYNKIIYTNFVLKGNIFAEYLDKPFERINCAIGIKS